MKDRCLMSMGALSAVIVASLIPVILAGQPLQTGAKTTSGTPPRTAWGAPDLQGIWSNQSVVPLERPKQLGTREFLTEEERAALEKQLAQRAEAAKGGLTGFRDKRKEVGTEEDVAGAYNAIWEGIPLTKAGKRTSQVIDPPDGRIPPMTPEAKKRLASQRDYLNMLLLGSSGSLQP